MSRPNFELKSLTGLAGMLVLVLQVPAMAELRDCQLVVSQGGRRTGVHSSAWLRVPSRAPKSATTLEFEPTRTFMVAVPPAGNTASWRQDQPVDIAVRTPSEVVFQDSLSPAPATPALVADQHIRTALARALVEAGRQEVAAVLSMSVSIRPFNEAPQAQIEHLLSAGTGLVIHGQVSCPPHHAIGFVTDDFEDWALARAVALEPAGSGEGREVKVGQARAGLKDFDVTAVISDSGRQGRDVYLIDIDPAQNDAIFYGPIGLAAVSDGEQALGLVRRAFGDIRGIELEQADAVYRPLLATRKHEMQAQVFDFGPKLRQDKPIASIIIPFYGDAFFLNCVHYLQRMLDDSFELVLVVDDPRIWPEIYNGLALRSTGLRVPTRLLRNLANYGYGGANNLGAGLSRGDVLFLMNSDILVKDLSGLVKAAEAIRDRKRDGRRELLVGFSLLYEDDTLQHLGMTFPRSSAMGNLLVADHPMKGLPFDFSEVEPVLPAQAVTGALMGLSKELFQELEGFDLRFERGDFEDADLCLRARQLGAEIQVHVHPGLYHLERQSIPAMGDGDIRAMVTYMNCAEFNRRWEAELTKPKRVFKVSSPKATA